MLRAFLFTMLQGCGGGSTHKNKLYSAPDIRKLGVRFPKIPMELKISMYRIWVCFCLYGAFLPVTCSIHPFSNQNTLIFELICESVTINAFRNPESTCWTAYRCFIFASIQTPQCSVASPYHVFLEEHMFSE